MFFHKRNPIIFPLLLIAIYLALNGCSHTPLIADEEMTFEQDYSSEDDWGEDFEDIDQKIRNKELLEENVEVLQYQQEVLIAKVRELEEILFMLDIQVDLTEERIEDRLTTSDHSELLEQDVDQLENQISNLKGEIIKIRSETVRNKKSNTRPSKIPLEYKWALSDYRSGKYEDSIIKFQDLALENPQENLKDNIEYWIGCNYAKLDMYDDAIGQFKTVLRNYSGGNKVHDSRYMLGLSHYYNGRSNHAIEILEDALRHNPPFEVKNKIMKKLKEIREYENNFTHSF